MAMRNEAYVDTSALIAFLDSSDVYHSLFKQLFADPPSLITTPLVVAECHGWFLRRYGINRANDFLILLEQLPNLAIHSVGVNEQAGAIVILRRFKDQKLTLVDAVGLHLMQRKKTSICWSTDFHMALTGVPLAIHQS
jgi:predicted nucleic acid-binding protein